MESKKTGKTAMHTVMLAEDDQTMVNLLKTLLEIEGFLVKIYGGKTHPDLIQLLEMDKPDVLLMDVHLDTLNGIDALRVLRQRPGLNSLKVIMTSGSDVKDQCLKEGANGFLMKPYMPNLLIKMIDDQLSNA
jgi:CheY-like chemotaxis protein